MSGRHEPVLLGTVLGFLRQGEGLYLDATLGDAGHAEALLESEPRARLLGADRDLEALERARERLRRFGDRVSLAHATFRELPEAHRRFESEPFAGALLDLGLSSPQIDDPARGMSFLTDGPLDLRMDASRGMPARERLKTVDERELAAILAEHGDLHGTSRLARAVVEAAREGRLETTLDLAGLVRRSMGGNPHPRRLAQVFQALRIWINEEAEELDAALEWLPSVMRPRGTVVTLAYHSGEDRRIKRALRGTPRAIPSRRRPAHPNERPPERPWQELTPKVVTPTSEEMSMNPRSRSARLRAFRRNAS